MVEAPVAGSGSNWQTAGFLLERRDERENLTRLLSSYSNNSNNPRCGTDLLRGVS
jgi:hypothetical protein